MTPLNLIERSGPAFKSLAVAESGDRLFIGTRETGRILIYSLKEQRIVSELPESLRYCNHLLLHSNNEELLAFYHDGVISNWKLADEELAWRVDTGVRFLNKASLSTNGRMLAIGYTKGSPQIYSISGSGIQHITTLRTPTSLKTSLDFSPDGSTLVTGNVAGKIVLWDTSSWEAQLEMGHPHTKVTHVRFSPDGQVLAASGDKGLSLWKIDRDAGQ